MSAMDELNELVESIPGGSSLTVNMKQGALNKALVPDASGVWPTKPGYVPTYDPYYAALILVGFLQAQPTLRRSASEGTEVSVDGPNWGALLTYYRSMSQIAQAGSSGPIRKVLIPEGPHVVRTDMSGTGGHDYGDVDTDVS